MSDRTFKLHSDVTGALWFAGWLFTLGFVKLGFWAGALSLIIWPWYLGRALAMV